MAFFELEGRQVPYKVRLSRRARRLGLVVHTGGQVVLTIPAFFRGDHAAFVKKHAKWIHASRMRLIGKTRLPGGVKDYRTNREKAARLVKDRIQHFNEDFNFVYRKISIRNASTRWGSCSRKGNLNFNYKLVYLEQELVDYVVVHELCHLKELNHSKAFWELVATQLPDHKALRQKLRSFVL